MSIESDVELRAQSEQKAQTTPVAEAKETEQKVELSDVSESEAEQVSAETSDESETSPDEETETEESEDKEKIKPKKKGVEKRIDKLVREREFWKAEALKPKAEPKTESKDAESPKVIEGKPNPDNFKTHEEYLDARDAWNRRQWKAEEAEQTLKTREQRQIDSYKERAREFAKAHADWDEVTSEISDISPSITLYREIIESENGPELYYELAKQPEEFKRICALGPVQAARELGKFEALLKSKDTSEKPEPKKITKAPKPLAPVGTKSAITKNLYDPNLSQRDFERLRAEQIKQNRMRN